VISWFQNLLFIWVNSYRYILVNQPYFNEPGYERLIGTADGGGLYKLNNTVDPYSLKAAWFQPFSL
jgi:hypothetical protein